MLGVPMKLDVDRELVSLDTCLGDFAHPISAPVQRRALEQAAEIIAGAPREERLQVAMRIQTMLLRHGISESTENLMKTYAVRLHQRIDLLTPCTSVAREA